MPTPDHETTDAQLASAIEQLEAIDFRDVHGITVSEAAQITKRLRDVRMVTQEVDDAGRSLS